MKKHRILVLIYQWSKSSHNNIRHSSRCHRTVFLRKLCCQLSCFFHAVTYAAHPNFYRHFIKRWLFCFHPITPLTSAFQNLLPHHLPYRTQHCSEDYGNKDFYGNLLNINSNYKIHSILHNIFMLYFSL